MNKVTIESIIEAARNSGRELTENQAESILRRHIQIVQDANQNRGRNQQNDNWNGFNRIRE
jgi:vacuolar-type H+-ATPase subunit H